MQQNELEDPKGLFTFYKEQQQEEDQSKKMVKKKKKGKNKKGKKHGSQDQDPVRGYIQEKVVTEGAEKNSSEMFLKNVVGRYGLKPTPCEQIGGSLRLSTEPPASSNDDKNDFDIKLFKIQQKKKREQEIGRIMFNDKQKKDPPLNKQLQKSNHKISQLHYKINQADIFDSSRHTGRSPISIIEAVDIKDGMIVPRSCKDENRSFLDKLKHLEKKSRSNLTSSREAIRRDQGKVQMKEESNKYFQNLVSNFYRQHQDNSHNLKSHLKFPHISKEQRITRIKTQQPSTVIHQKVIIPIKSVKQIQHSPVLQSRKLQKLHSQMKSFSTHKRSLKLKSFQKYQQLYKIKMCQMRQGQHIGSGKLLNFIDLSQQYHEQLVDTQQRMLKKKILKSRLGIDY